MAFTLATFNTFWLFDEIAPPLKRCGIKLPEGGIDKKLDLTVEAIVSICPDGPDIIALQEVEGPIVLDPLLEKLKKANPDYKYWWSSETLDPFTGQNVAVVSKFPAAIEPVKRLDHILDYIDHSECLRAGSLGKFLRVDIEVDGQVLSLYVIHLKSMRGGTEETRLLRDVQSKIVRRVTLPRVEQGNSYSPSFVAVVGDFNDVPKSSPLDIIQGKRDTSYNLESATVNLSEDEKWTHTYDGNKQQLDHILLNKFSNDRLVSSGITRVDDDTSDHDAVWAKIDLST